jgi:hypothetical protein
MSFRSTEVVLSSDEEHQGELSPMVSGRHSCDPRWAVEEWANEGETWGKTTTDSGISHAEGERKWLGQSVANRQRAAGGVSPREGERNGEGEKSSAEHSFYREGEREGTTVVPHICDKMPVACRIGWTTARNGSPSPRSLVLSRDFKPGANPNWYELYCSSVRPANNCFSIFPN